MGRQDVKLEPVELEEPGQEPCRYTILDNMMLRMCKIEEPGPWQAALKEYLKELNLQEGAEI